MPWTPVLVSLLVGSLLCLVAWGYWQAGRRPASDAARESSDVVLVALSVLAILALVIFLAEVLLSTHSAGFLHFS